MASTVFSAFEDFLTYTIRLNHDSTIKARSSRDNLISSINDFSGNEDFFELAPKHNLKFGSFARRTKIRPLDDIDLMFCISGNGRLYCKNNDTYYLTGIDSDKSNGLLSNDGFLNSTKVINRFIKKLGILHDYRMAVMHKKKEAATLKLNSYDWNFDIVPCWYMDIDKFLIPDGFGNWKITDPRVDNERTTSINQKHDGKILDLIRIMKYWNNRNVTPKIGSYLLECMILDKYDIKKKQTCYWIDIEVRDLFSYLSNKILGSVYDPKGIQGDLNNFSYDDKKKISLALADAHQKAIQAVMSAYYNEQEDAILKWREIFGSDFPYYS